MIAAAAASFGTLNNPLVLIVGAIALIVSQVDRDTSLTANAVVSFVIPPLSLSYMSDMPAAARLALILDYCLTSIPPRFACQFSRD